MVTFGGGTFGKKSDLDETRRAGPPQWDQTSYEERKGPELTLSLPREDTTARKRALQELSLFAF